MKDTFKVIFKNEPNVLILGDYNFDNEKEYQLNIKNYGYDDVIN